MTEYRPTRRAWLAAAISCLVAEARADEPPPDDDRERQRVEDRARQVGLGPLRINRTEHYLGIGDADDAYRKQALQICENLALDFLDHYSVRGFHLERPKHRLTVVILANNREFAAY